MELTYFRARLLFINLMFYRNDMQTIFFYSRSESDEKHKKKSKINYRSCIVYRRGQKQLTRLFLREAEHLLELSAKEQT